MTTVPRSRLTWTREDSMATAETSALASKTTPDQALSLKDLISRHTRGIPIPTFEPVYTGELDLPDFNRMDPMQIQDYYSDLQEYIDENRPLIEQIIRDNETNTDPPPEVTPPTNERSESEETPDS